jgi:UDP-GlcNAc:undecaprenyl-phosphate GlcNAc-1-phosphate transferase
MLAGCSVGWLWMVVSGQLGIGNQIGIEPITALVVWLAALLPVAGGIYEDLTQRLGPRYRLLLSVLGAAIAVGVLQMGVTRLGLPGFDEWWLGHAWMGMVFAVFAISGLPHAFNLIDGYNGLAGLVAVICSLAVAYVALQVGDRQLAALVLALAGATAGFLVWNYPRGLIFAGDGGAYLWGAVIAMVCVLLVQRHSQVSPWFPALLLIYPVWETLFSIWRKAVRGVSPGVADALHFHQLIYRRIVRRVFHDDESRRMLMRNNRTSPYLWGFSILTVCPAVLFWSHTLILMGFTLLFVVCYVYAYRSIVRFRVPRWLRR